MATDPTDGGYPCENCGEVFERREELNEHIKEVHGATAEEAAEKSDDGAEDSEHEDTAAAGSDAAGSTGSITEETNDSPSAAEPSEAAGPSGSGGDVRPDADDADDRNGDGS